MAVVHFLVTEVWKLSVDYVLATIIIIIIIIIVIVIVIVIINIINLLQWCEFCFLLRKKNNKQVSMWE